MVKRMLGMLVLVSAFGIVWPVKAIASETPVNTSDLLTSAQVNTLLLSAKTPADRVTLQKHFSALADKYEGDAYKRTAEAQSFRDNWNPGSHFPGSPVLKAQRRDRLAESARNSEQEARELASAFEQKTPADHVKLQAFYATIADKYEGDASKHAAEAQSYRDNWNPGSHFPGSPALRAKHCDRLAESARNSAQEARERSSEHGQMAAAG